MFAARDVPDHESPKAWCRCADCRRARISGKELPDPFPWEIQVVPWDEI
jgi:hypothetical protein